MFVAFASDSIDRVARTLMLVRSGRQGQMHWVDPQGFGWSDGKGATDTTFDECNALGAAAIHAVDARPQSLDGRAALNLAMRALQSELGLANVSGKFGFVVWNRRTRELQAVRDHLGVAPLYWSDTSGDLYVSDSVEFLGSRDDADPQALRQFIVRGRVGVERSVWKNVQPVAAASILRWQSRCPVVTRRYFSLLDCRVPVPDSDEETASEGRRLMIEAVRSAAGGRRVWTDLSGGHDSSAVASIAGWLRRQSGAVRVDGTVTFVDTIGEGDERQYVDAVLSEYSLDSITIVDPCPWDGKQAPAPTPLPSRDYPFWQRDQLLTAELKRRGCEALLSGIGPDYYLPLTCAHAIDLARHLRAGDSMEVFTEWTLQNRSNFWREGYRELLTPLMPVFLQRRMRHAATKRPAWLRADFICDREFKALQVERDVVRAWPGRVCAERVAQRLGEMPGSLHGWRNVDIAIEHPFLYLPLVRFCLSLDWRKRTNFSRPKPILRQALSGIVPDRVLDRHTKGSLVLPRVTWAFARRRERLRSLLKNPVLGDLKVIEPTLMMHAIDDAAAGRESARHLYFALSLETWLSTHANRNEFLAA